MYSFPYLEPVCCSMFSSTCCFLTCIQVSQEAGQVVWYSHLFQSFPQFIVIHIVKGFFMVNKVEVGVFEEFSCFFYDPMNVDTLISGSSAFSKSSLNIWNFTVYVLWRLAWRNYFGSMWDEWNCVVVEHSLKSPFLGLQGKRPIQSCGHYWVFHICWHIECSTFTASSSLGSDIALLQCHPLH